MFNYAAMNLQEDWGLNKDWTLFLDRDGVINIEKHLDYIRSAEELQCYPGVIEKFSTLNQVFGRVVVVTNQRGIGKGLMTTNDLQSIHHHLSRQLKQHQAHIDAYYFAPDIDSLSPNRKPNTGMALQAKQQFSEIDFERSIMVGNNLSDMEFGKRMLMKTVFVETTTPIEEPHPWIDLKLPDLVSFIELLG